MLSSRNILDNQFSILSVKTNVLFLSQDLLNFDDPLNIDAAEHHLRDKVEHQQHLTHLNTLPNKSTGTVFWKCNG